MSQPSFSTDDLARIQVPSSPARWGGRIVYVLKRADKEGKRYKTSLWAVSGAGGEPSRLTMGEHADRQPLPSQDGRFLLFVSDREHGDQVWRLNASGGEARRLTSFGHGSLGPAALSPDGRTLVIAFTAALAPGEVAPLATHRLDHPAGDDGPSAFPGFVEGAKEAEWKAAESVPMVRVYGRPHTRTDGSGWECGFLAHLWAVDVATGAARRLTSGPHAYGMPDFAPDGTWVVATRTPLPSGDRDVTRNELVRIDVADGGVTVLPKADGLADAPSVSPDGARVAYVLAPPDDLWGWQNPRVAVTHLASGEATRLALDLDRPVGDWCLDDLSGAGFLPWRPLWDGTDAVVVVASDRASSRLLRVGLDSSHGWLTAWGQGVGSPIALGGGRIGVLHGAPANFVEVAMLNDGELTRLSDHNRPVAASAAPRAPRSIELEVDGVGVQAWYLPPRHAIGPSPAILYIHGGPHTAYGPRLFFEMHWLADQGFAVLWTNPRGSHTFGEEHARCIDPHWGTPDGRDQLSFADWLALQPEVDGTRIGVTGGSYGGFMSCFLAATTTRFAAAVADRGLYDWALDVGASDFGHAVPETFGFDLPWRDPAAYQPYSLLAIAHQITCPFLVMHGEGDMRCDKGQALSLYETLLRAGTPTALVLFPEEDHSMTRGGRIDRRAERLRQLSAWFKRFLG